MKHYGMLRKRDLTKLRLKCAMTAVERMAARASRFNLDIAEAVYFLVLTATTGPWPGR